MGVNPANQTEVWFEHRTSDGRVYYSHPQTQKTTWDRPHGAQIIPQPTVTSGTPSGMLERVGWYTIAELYHVTCESEGLMWYTIAELYHVTCESEGLMWYTIGELYHVTCESEGLM